MGAEGQIEAGKVKLAKLWEELCRAADTATALRIKQDMTVIEANIYGYGRREP